MGEILERDILNFLKIDNTPKIYLKVWFYQKVMVLPKKIVCSDISKNVGNFHFICFFKLFFFSFLPFFRCHTSFLVLAGGSTKTLTNHINHDLVILPKFRKIPWFQVLVFKLPLKILTRKLILHHLKYGRDINKKTFHF